MSIDLGKHSQGPSPLAAIDPVHRQLAALGHGLSFVEGGVLGPLLLYVIKKDESEFVAFHALQSLYFGLVFLAVVTLSCGIGLPLVLVYIGFEIKATIEASNGAWYCLPVVGEWAWQKHSPATARARGQGV